MTKLDAVNLCLRALSLAPVTSYASGSDPQSIKAAAKVDEVTETVLESGWSCNTDYKVTLALDTAGKCVLPADTLVVTAGTYNSGLTRVSMRMDPADTGVKLLWDVRNKTWNFSTSAPDGVTVDIVHSFAFDDLPPVLQRYIAARAAREYQEEDVGSIAVDKMVARREQDAYAALLSAEAEEQNWNVLTDNEHCAAITGRNNPHFGR